MLNPDPIGVHFLRMMSRKVVVDLVMHQALRGVYVVVEPVDADVTYLNITSRLANVVCPSVVYDCGKFSPPLCSPVGSRVIRTVDRTQYQFPRNGPSTRVHYRIFDRVLVAWRNRPNWTVWFSKGMVDIDSSGPMVSIQHAGSNNNVQQVPRDCIYMWDWHDLHRACRAVTLQWLLLYRRLGLYRDIGTLIGRFIWHSRDESEWGEMNEH